jgi:hypothetical protein
VDWSELFVVFLVLHLVGDFALQTEWQAGHKRGGLGPDPVARRALAAHALTYTLVFVPAFVWLSRSEGVGMLEWHQLDRMREAGRRAALEALERAPESLLG